MSKSRYGRNWARWGVCVSVSVLLGLGLPLSSGAQEDLPEGFKQQGLPSPPPAEQIEAGKRVYFTKCVWCHGVGGA
ncbi:MAG: cytochrome c, partial [Nitrospira sp. SB0666_bin_27]|nr:cytochrome c [Nitrospira sp. SB0666_bin_27]